MAKKQTMDHAQLLVLSLLAGEDMYGYQMIVELARRSDHTFEMKEGTLYPVLHGLERDGAVEAYQQEAPTGRMRKYYRLTRRGAAVLREEAAAWQTYSGAVNAVLQVTNSRNKLPIPFPNAPKKTIQSRSEERRVGKECRSRWSPYH